MSRTGAVAFRRARRPDPHQPGRPWRYPCSVVGNSELDAPKRPHIRHRTQWIDRPQKIGVRFVVRAQRTGVAGQPRWHVTALPMPRWRVAIGMALPC